MCGINGFSTLGGSASGGNNKILIEKMNKKIEHRGPDGEGFYLDKNISLGHRRLSIIDLSENGKQPMFNEDKSFCIIFNGEIYNFQQLKKDLEKMGHRFISNTDTEVVLHLYEDKREKCLDLLNGIFAFAIYDIKNKELFLARDRIGVKPLYYYYNGSKFIFSSEIKAILEHDIKREIDLEALNHYFRLMYVPAPLTMFRGIYKLPQAHYLRFKDNQVEIKQYWDIRDFREIKSEQEIVEKIQELMKQSVRGQLISDRPVGIFLSGGIDSTSVLGIAREFTEEEIRTYTVGFDIYDPTQKFKQDILLARQTSQYYSTKHSELMISSKDILENIEKVIYHMDEPVAEPTQIATFLLSELAKKEVAVVLGGDGGDELFGGYKRYYYSYLINKYGATKFFPFLKRIIHKRFMFQKEEEIDKFLNKGINNKKITEQFFEEKYFKNKSIKDYEKLFMLTDLKTWLADESLMRSDKMTMAQGLEERVPVLDHQLIELAMKIPTKYKIKDENHGKKIFIKAMKGYLPQHIFESEKKKVWMTPMSEWLRTDLNEFAKKVLSSDYIIENKKYFNFENIQKILTDHVKRKKYNLNLIWALIVFQIWHKQYINND